VSASRGGHRTLRIAHHPNISTTADGRWVVVCPQCEAHHQPLPIGIGMPLESRLTAERLRENHTGRPLSNLS
jgi:hypothetical protein